MKAAKAEAPTWRFQDRYSTDAEFKRQVDDARRRKDQTRHTAALQTSLDMTRGLRKATY